MPGELPPIDPELRIGAVELAVADLSRSVDFYERVLGLALISRGKDDAQLGAGGERPSLRLSAIARPTAAPVHSTGLFHVAWLHPSRAALAATVRRVMRERWRVDGAADHGVSEALYLSDPDGLGIEIYADRPREQWERSSGASGVHIVTLPLDVQDLLAQDAAGPAPAIDSGTSVGHVHLKVADVPRAAAFYRDALGFAEQAQMPSAAFLAAGGYHHHVGLNSWQSHGAAPAPASAPGLRRVEFELGDAGALDALARRLADTRAGADAGETAADDTTRDGATGGISLRDPDGQLLVFRSD